MNVHQAHSKASAVVKQVSVHGGGGNGDSVNHQEYRKVISGSLHANVNRIRFSF